MALRLPTNSAGGVGVPTRGCAFATTWVAALGIGEERRNALARVDVSVSSKVEPEAAWKLASDLDRFDEWMTIFAGWRSPVPDTIEEGTCVSSCVKVKGFRNVIH